VRVSGAGVVRGAQPARGSEPVHLLEVCLGFELQGSQGGVVTTAFTRLRSQHCTFATIVLSEVAVAVEPGEFFMYCYELLAALLVLPLWTWHCAEADMLGRIALVTACPVANCASSRVCSSLPSFKRQQCVVIIVSRARCQLQLR
jgi:hypothetical protein